MSINLKLEVQSRLVDLINTAQASLLVAKQNNDVVLKRSSEILIEDSSVLLRNIEHYFKILEMK